MVVTQTFFKRYLSVYGRINPGFEARVRNAISNKGKYTDGQLFMFNNRMGTIQFTGENEIKSFFVPEGDPNEIELKEEDFVRVKEFQQGGKQKMRMTRKIRRRRRYSRRAPSAG